MLRTFIVAALVALACGQGLPSAADCQSRSQALGVGLLTSLSACQGAGSSPSAACCSAANGLLGFPGSGQLAGCLCTAEGLQGALAAIEGNALARSAGVTSDSVKIVLRACKVANVELEGSCGGSRGASDSTDSNSSDGDKSDDNKAPTKAAAVSVQAPGTTVDVKAPAGGAKTAAVATPAVTSAPLATPAVTTPQAGGKLGVLLAIHQARQQARQQAAVALLAAIQAKQQAKQQAGAALLLAASQGRRLMNDNKAPAKKHHVVRAFAAHAAMHRAVAAGVAAKLNAAAEAHKKVAAALLVGGAGAKPAAAGVKVAAAGKK